jgi:multisubunit Na+/H+ antiporter MnhF subunit
MGRRSRARPRVAPRPPAAAGAGGARRGPTAADRLLALFNPRKTPTRSRVRAAAALFAALSLVLALLGLLLNRAYLQPALLTAILALLWGVRSATMR